MREARRRSSLPIRLRLSDTPFFCFQCLRLRSSSFFFSMGERVELSNNVEHFFFLFFFIHLFSSFVVILFVSREKWERFAYFFFFLS